MPSSRAVLVLGMHRSGTSALARGLQMLGVYLGNHFISPNPDNPTGYWEDRNIFGLNERLLAVFGLKWEEVALIDDARWDESGVEAGGSPGGGRPIKYKYCVLSLWGLLFSPS